MTFYSWSKFFVFYDGDSENEPVEKIMKLSDAFGGSSDLELVVHSVNINLNKNAEILAICHYLHDYSTLISYDKLGLANGLSRRQAITNAINRCIQENIMKDYLIDKKEEVFSMLDFQWNLDDAKAAWRDEAIDEERTSIALDMLKDGLPFEQIQKFTKLTLGKIQELANNIHS